MSPMSSRSQQLWFAQFGKPNGHGGSRSSRKGTATRVIDHTQNSLPACTLKESSEGEPTTAAAVDKIDATAEVS